MYMLTAKNPKLSYQTILLFKTDIELDSWVKKNHDYKVVAIDDMAPPETIYTNDYTIHMPMILEGP